MKYLKDCFRGLGVVIMVCAISVMVLMPLICLSAPWPVGDFIGSAPSWLLYTMFASMWIVLGVLAAQFICYTNLEDQNKALKTTYDEVWKERNELHRQRNKLLNENHKLETELDTRASEEDDDEYTEEYFDEEENDDSILTIRVRMIEVDADDDEQPEASSPCCGGCPCRNAAPTNNEAEELEEFLNGLSSAFDAALRSSEPRNTPRQGWYTTTITSNITT